MDRAALWILRLRYAQNTPRVETAPAAKPSQNARHCERSKAIQNLARRALGLLRLSARNDGRFVVA
ncbi:MAG: hypothetical protein LBG78_07755 [Azoarcus sp.]|nr:hypothetical protein [Azoarcus sp.]